MDETGYVMERTSNKNQPLLDIIPYAHLISDPSTTTSQHSAGHDARLSGQELAHWLQNIATRCGSLNRRSNTKNIRRAARGRPARTQLVQCDIPCQFSV